MLQRRRNHDAFELSRVSIDRHPALTRHYRVTEVPTICIVEDRRLKKRIVAPRGRRDLQRELAPWLR